MPTRLLLPSTAWAAVLVGATVAGPAPEPAGGKVAFLRQWGGRGTEPGQFHFPIGVAVGPAGEVYVTDHVNHRVQVFDPAGKLLAHFPVLPNPAGVAPDRDGNLVLTHFHASSASKEESGDRVSVYSPAGKLLRQWGRRGEGDGEFNCPGGVAVARDGTVYVADQTNHRVQAFDPAGKYLFQWGGHGNDPGKFGGRGGPTSRVGGPQFVAVDAAGGVWTTEGPNCRVQQFTPKGWPVRAWGSADDRAGALGGLFEGFKDRKPPTSLRGPIALCFDRAGRVWVGAVSGRVQRYSTAGEFQCAAGGGQGSGPGQFLAPHGLAVDRAGRLVVVDSYNHRVQVFDAAP